MNSLAWPAQDPAPPPADDGGGGWNPVPDLVGSSLSGIAQNAFSDAMQTVWDSAIWLLKGGFSLADTVSHVSPATITGNDADSVPVPAPVPGSAAPPPDPPQGALDLGSLWSTMIWLAALIALGLFFYQLASVALRGGRGMFRAVTGPVQFGIALAVTTGAVAALLTGADGLTAMFLSNLGEQGSFTAIMDNPAVADRFGDNPDLGADVEDSVRSMILGIAALFGVIPAAIGFALAMIFRAAAIMVLIATIPIAAACLVSDTTASMFWRAVRWILAAVLMKPALALVVVIGVNIMSRTQGVAGLLAGTAVLLISLFCPMVLYRLLAFVDPGTGAGIAVRSFGSSSMSGSGPAGSDSGSSEATNIARHMQSSSSSGAGPASSGGGELGGSTATSPAATGRAAGAGGSAGGAASGGAAAGGAGGGAAAGGVAAGVGAAGGIAGAALVGGYLATKAAAQAAGGYGSSQMAQTGVGHPGPAPGAGPSGDMISSAAGSAAHSAQDAKSYTAIGPYSVGIDPGDSPGSSGPAAVPPGGAAPDPPPVDPGPPEAGRPDTAPSSGHSQDPPEPPPVTAGTDGAPTTPAPGPAEPPRTAPPRPAQPRGKSPRTAPPRTAPPREEPT
ncbi:hypothetical protein GCM10009772_06910 [Pseudonocardia alni subsp. carboxydivorans]|uniref:TrbL/VirB6 plasmid conjugal transfer protein n=1 Tax=Pseudonocardia alni subsp. carboxydivorans TaxID=415010 RepID=A0ABU9AM08_PSEA5|nr:hypothetical protein [Pseudonocardia sp. ICBG1034]